MNNARFNHKSAALISVCVFILECVVDGAGRLVSIGDVSLRMMLFAIAFVMTIPEVIRKFRSLCKIGYFHALGLFFVLLAAAAIYGLTRGNSVAFVRADVTSFLTLLLLPGAVAILDTRERIAFAVGIVAWGSLSVALATCSIHVVSPFVPKTFIANLSDFFSVTEGGGLSLYSDAENLYRIYLKSQTFLPLGAILFLKYAIDSDKKRELVLFVAAAAVNVYATVLSFTRGFWLGLAVALVLFFVFNVREKTAKLLSVAAILVAFTVVFFGVSALIYRSNVTLDAVINRVGLTVGPGSAGETDVFSGMEKSDELGDGIREKTLDALYERLRARFFSGYGLGANLDGIRTEGKTEYTYLDMLIKLGVPGFVVFVWVTTWHVVRAGEDGLRRLFRRKKDEKSIAYSDISPVGTSAESLAPALACGYVGMLISSIWNPFLLSPMGMLMLILLTVASIGEKVGEASRKSKEE